MSGLDVNTRIANTEGKERGYRRRLAATHATKRVRIGERLGDFTTTSRVLLMALIAICIGVVSTFVALALLRLIGLITNLFFFQRWDASLVSPAGNRLGIFEIFVPVL